VRVTLTSACPIRCEMVLTSTPAFRAATTYEWRTSWSRIRGSSAFLLMTRNRRVTACGSTSEPSRCRDEADLRDEGGFSPSSARQDIQEAGELCSSSCLNDLVTPSGDSFGTR